MTEHTLDCCVSDGDYAKAQIDSDGDVRLEVACSGSYAHINARPAEFAEFARAVLTGTGESLDDGALKVGDYVEVTKDREWTSEDVGKSGRLEGIDADGLPYLVEGVGWVMDVRKVTPPTSTSSNPFAAYVDKAKRLLDGTAPTAADIVALARELADRA